MTLRLLPTAENAQEHVLALLGKKSTAPARYVATEALICSKIYDPGRERGSVRCLAAPYRQHWTEKLLEDISQEIRTREHRRMNQSKVLIEVYHFTHEEDEKRAIKETTEAGVQKLQKMLPESFGAVRCEWKAEDGESGAEVQLRCIGTDALPPHVQAKVNGILERGSAHLRSCPLPQRRCRTVILADTRLATRKQAQWARGQRVLVEQEGQVMEGSLVEEQEEELVLPIIEAASDLRELHMGHVDESQHQAWDPWEEYIDGVLEQTFLVAKRQELQTKIEEVVFAAPWAPTSDEIERAIRELRRRGALRTEAARALQEHWDVATDVQRLQLLRLVVCGKGPAVNLEELKLHEKYEGEKALELVQLWREHKDWSGHPLLHSLAQGDKAVREQKRALRAQVQVPLGPGRRKPAAPTAGADAALRLLEKHYVHRPKAEALIPVEERAIAVAKASILQGSNTERDLRLVWFAVVGTERAAAVVAFIRSLHEMIWARGNIWGMQLCTLARFWAATCRTPQYRGHGYEKRRDAVYMPRMEKWLYSRGAPAWYKTASAAEVEEASLYWSNALRREARFMDFLAREAKEKNERAGVAAETATGWRQYSTSEAAERRCAAPLEVLKRNLSEADARIQEAWQQGLLAAEGCRLLVAGPLARKFWTLLKTRGRFTVLLLGPKEAPQAGTNKKLASLTMTRRAIYQLDDATLQLHLRAPVFASLEEARIRECGNAIKYALSEIWQGQSDYILRTSAEAWWQRAQREDTGWPAPWAPNGRVVSLHLALLDDIESRSRQLHQGANELESLWRRRLVLTIRQAAAVASVALGDPCCTFLDTCMERLARASEEPLLRAIKAHGDFDAVRKAEALFYSQEVKTFVQIALAPLCWGPATTLRILSWFLADTSGLPKVLQAYADSLYKSYSLFRLQQHFPISRNGLYANHRFTAQEHEFLSQVAPYSMLPYSNFEHKRQRAMGLVVICRRRLLNAACFARFFAVRPEICATALLRASALTPSIDTGPVWTQNELLALLNSADPEAIVERLAEHPPAVALEAFLRPAMPLEPDLESTPLGGGLVASFIEGSSWQLDLLEAVHCVRNFAETDVTSAWRRMNREDASSALESLGAHEGAADLGRFLAGSIVHRSTNYEDLAAFLDDVEAYAAHRLVDGLVDGRVTQATRRLRAELLHYLHRSPRLKEAHAKQRRQQVESFTHVQRNLYFDRPRPRGVLHGWGHRIKGESEEIQCWIAEGEPVRPWPRVRRALAGDAVAEAWHGAWCAAPKDQKKRQHDISRSDIELARDVLCEPLQRGITDARGVVVRSRRSWEPDPVALAVPLPSALEALDPRPVARPKLGAHEIQQPVLRRLVAPENVPDVAWMECLLRADINGKPSHLALTQCPQMKRALEPLTHSIELWPLFAQRFQLNDLLDEAALLAAFAREGSPVPVASKMAACHALVPRAPCCTGPARPGGPLLSELRRLLKRRAPWPAVSKPSPIWNEKDLTGRERKRRRTDDLASYAVELPRLQAERLLRYERCASEARWFQEERLQTHWDREHRLDEWRAHQVRNSATYALCRPCSHYYRRLWVTEYQQLDMTPWCDAGHFPDQLQLHSAVLKQPAVFCSRSSGRRVQGGSLQFGPYTRRDHMRYVGEIGECVLYGNRQQSILRTLQQRGLVFIAINMDRTSMLKQFLAQASVLYLIGHWAHFPLFVGDGVGSFPWLGSRWTRGLLYLQQLVRQRLRALLHAPEIQETLSRIRRARHALLGDGATSARALHRDLAALRAVDATVPDVPELALKIEEVQLNAILIHRAGRREPVDDYTATAQELEATLADQARNDHPLLIFPTEEHMRGKCSAPLSEGGFLAPKDLGKWATTETVTRNAWPELGGLLEGNPRVQTSHAKPKSAPVLHGEHIVVLPDWAHYSRSLSERIGRGPRDDDAAWDCRANLCDPPPPEHAVHGIFQALARLRRAQPERYTSSREVVSLIAKIFPASRSRWRGLCREEPAEGAPLLPPEKAWLSPEFALHCKKDIRCWLEQQDGGKYIEVRKLVDVRTSREIKSATLCVRHAQFLKEERLLAAKGSSRLTPGFSLEGVLYLHGCQAPAGTETRSAQHIRLYSGGQRALVRECGALREELEKEWAEAQARTQDELSSPRWPQATPCMPELHGARAGARRGAVFVAGRAVDFIVEPLEAFTHCPCLALYPEGLRKPCYELQVASVRLLQRQLARSYRDEPLLLVAVGREAHRIFSSLELLLAHAPQDAVPLRLPGGELEELPDDFVQWQLPVHTGIATLTQLRNEENAQLLVKADPTLREEWAQLRRLIAHGR